MARKKKSDNWMADAFKPETAGTFTKKAEKAGMGVQEYAQKVTGPKSKASTKTKRQANLARVAQQLANKRKPKGGK